MYEPWVVERGVAGGVPRCIDWVVGVRQGFIDSGLHGSTSRRDEEFRKACGTVVFPGGNGK